MPRMRSVLIRIVPSSGGRGAAPWPVPWPAILSPFSAAKRTVAATSPALAAKATASGRWSAARFQARRAWSQSGSPGTATRPVIFSPLKSLMGAPFHFQAAFPVSLSGFRAQALQARCRHGALTASPRPMKRSLTIAGGKRPWAATPGSASSRAASSAGSAIGAAVVGDRAAVGAGGTSRSATSGPSRARVEAMPKEKSSSGTGPRRASTGLLESAMTTKRSAAAATIFSRRWAPRRP